MKQKFYVQISDTCKIRGHARAAVDAWDSYLRELDHLRNIQIENMLLNSNRIFKVNAKKRRK